MAQRPRHAVAAEANGLAGAGTDTGRVAVAVSGGLDSSALLHCTTRQARALGLEVVALHVHHGLMAQADDWCRRVRDQARRWGAAFDWRRLEGAPGRGESVEAWARAGRYAALTEMARAHGCGLVLLAHHRRDQAETFLLQALRGAGFDGLSGMPVRSLRNGIWWVRPWLDTPRSSIEAYARRHRLRTVDDPSNADPRLARARLRALWPALESAFAGAESALADAARHAQESARLLALTADADLQRVLVAEGIDVAAWRGLPPERGLQVLRAWLARVLDVPAPRALVQRLLHELPTAASARWPTGVPAQPWLQVYRGLLSAEPQDAGIVRGPEVLGLDLSRVGRHPVPVWQGSVVVSAVRAGGLPVAALRSARLGPRVGGERLALSPRAVARALKKQFQAAGVPARLRAGPLVWSADGRLLFVPGLGANGVHLAPDGAPQRRLRWEPDPA